MAAAEIVRAFTEDQVAQLTGITAGQLQYWDRTGFFQPEFAHSNRREPHSRIYSYVDLVSLKVVARLRKRVPLQRLRQVKEKLADLSPDLWRGIELWVHNRDVAFVHPETGEPEEVVSGQRLMKIALSDITEDLDAAVHALGQRDRSTFGTIEQHRRVMHNARVIGGTRIPVAAVREFHDAGYSPEQIMNEYPSLTLDDIEAALADDQAA